MHSEEATNTNFIVHGVTRPRLEPTISAYTWGENTNHCITDAVQLHFCLKRITTVIIDTCEFVFVIVNLKIAVFQYIQSLSYSISTHSNTIFHIRLCSCISTVTRRMWLVQKKLLILPKHMSLQPVCKCVCVAQSLVFYVVFRCALCFLCPLWPLYCCPSIYGFWRHIWHLQTFLRKTTVV